MDLIFSTYFSNANAVFVYLHLFVTLACAVLAAFWLRQILRLRQAESPASDSDMSRLIALFDPYAAYFDFCSSAFIFVGLIGTMNGFVNGIPKLRQADYNFADLQRALSTSAVGILCSLLFNSVTGALDFVMLRPRINRLRSQVPENAFESSIREHLNHIDLTVQRTLETFDRKTTAVTESIDAWKVAIAGTQGEYQKLVEGIKETAGNFTQTYRALVALPENVRSQLESVLRQGSQSLEVVLKEFASSLEGVKTLPGRLEQSIDQSFFERKKVLDEALAAYRDALAQQATQLLDIFEKTDQVPRQVAENLRISSEAAVSALKSAQEPFLDELRKAVRSSVQDQITLLGATAAELRNDASTLQSKWSDLLDREKVAMQDAMVSALQKSTEVVDRHRENLMRIESALPESLSAVFTMLIQETQQATRSLNAATEAHRSSVAAVTEALRQLADDIRIQASRAFKSPLPAPAEARTRTSMPSERPPKGTPPIAPDSALKDLAPAASRKGWKRLFGWWRRRRSRRNE